MNGWIRTGATRMNSAVIPPTTRKKSQKIVDATRQARVLALLEELAEDRDERGREGGVRDERAHQVRDLEGDGERVDRPAPEVVRSHDLAHSPSTRESPVAAEKIASTARDGVLGRSAAPRVSESGQPIGGRRCRSATILPARKCGHFFEMPNIQQQKKRVRIAERQREENLRYRSTVKTLTKRLEAAVAAGEGRDRGRAPRSRAPDRQGSVERGDSQEHRRAQEVPRARLVAGRLASTEPRR